MIIKARLTPKDITKALNTVRWYENYLQYKLEQLVSELAEVGIVVAQDNTYVEVDNVYKNMGDFILFEKNVSKTKTGAECILIAVGKPYIKSTLMLWMPASRSIACVSSRLTSSSSCTTTPGMPAKRMPILVSTLSLIK